MRCDLGGAGYRNDLDIAASLLEEPSRDAREGGRDAARTNVRERGDAALVAGRDDETTAAEIEIEAHVEVALRFAHEIPPRNARIGRAVSHEFRNVLRANEDRLEFAPQRRRQRAVAARTHGQSRVLEQLARFFSEPPLVGERDLQHERTMCEWWTEKNNGPSCRTGRGGRRSDAVRSTAHPLTRELPRPGGHGC